MVDDLYFNVKFDVVKNNKQKTITLPLPVHAPTLNDAMKQVAEYDYIPWIYIIGIYLTKEV